MDLHNTALVVAGVVGSTVAIVHGFIMQRLIVRPIHELTVGQLPSTIRRLVAGLSHFTTFNWFVSAWIAYRYIFIRAGGKTGDGILSRKLLLV